MTLPMLPNRDNMALRSSELWRPPVFRRETNSWDRSRAALRRFFDLQAASIWNDLQSLLSHCRGSLLDVGCGAQPYRVLLPKTVTYLGIDTTDAQANFGYTVLNTTYFTGETWPVESCSISTVLATETLEHVEHPEQFLAEARRVLQPGGTLILTVPFAARWHYIPYDYWRFTPSGLQSLLTDAGFTPPVVYARGNELTVACYKVMALILMLLLGTWDSGSVRLLARFTGCLLIPLFLVTSVLGQLSLKSRGGNDCLGYTAIAVLPEPSGDCA